MHYLQLDLVTRTSCTQDPLLNPVLVQRFRSEYQLHLSHLFRTSKWRSEEDNAGDSIVYVGPFMGKENGVQKCLGIFEDRLAMHQIGRAESQLYLQNYQPAKTMSDKQQWSYPIGRILRALISSVDICDLSSKAQGREPFEYDTEPEGGGLPQ